MDFARRLEDGPAIIAGLEYRILGPLKAVLGGVVCNLGGPRQRMVLAVLLAHANRVVSQDAIIDAVWAGEAPEAPRATLHTYVSLLRKELGGEIHREGQGYRVEVGEDQLDAARFERLVAEGRALLETDPAGAQSLLQTALALWTGLPYGDLGSEPALVAEVVRLDELRLTAVEHRLEAMLAIGHHLEIVGELETLIRENPYRERLRGLQMLALYRSGRQAEALRAYQRTRSLLADELGIDPSAELRELEQRILDQDPSLIVHTAAAPPTGGSGRSVRGYELREEIGRGDLGIVYRAYQPSTGREVALKVIRPEIANRPDFVARFEDEAQHIVQLEHPHLAGLLDYWRDPGGAYLVVPFLRGGSLAKALAHGAWNLSSALKLLDEVGRALGYAHRRGIVHGDLKASNVLLDEEGNAYLTDFRIAPMATQAAALTAPSDICSLGSLSFYLLTGVESLVRPLPPLSNTGLPPELGRVLNRATDASRGYDKVEDFLRAARLAVGADVVAVAAPEKSTPSTPVRNPYKGLRAFTETDAGDFHGRTGLVAELLEAVANHPLVMVVGPSGSGKSSVVRAGLIPALRAAGDPHKWLITDMFPGSFPFEELEAALVRVAVERPPGLIDDLVGDERGLLRVIKQILPADDSRLLLIIDQFEELFSAVAAEETRRLFLESLVTVAGDERSRVKVVITMRADFFDRPLEHATFGALVGEGLVTVATPPAEGLAQAIANPAREVGVELEPGLVGEIVHEVEGQPGALPLLQYALTELFGRREGNELTIDAYRANGGVKGALGRRAEELFSELSPHGQEAARQLFLRLVTVDEDAGDTRRRVRLAELRGAGFEQKALDAVLSRFGTFRLLTYDRDPVSRGPTVEVAHEALLWAWPRLAGWIDAERESLLLYRRIREAAREWSDSGRDPSFLLRGGRLEQAGRWQEEADMVLSSEETTYLEASRRQRDAEAKAAKRRRRLIFGLLTGGLVVAVVLASLALWQRGVAQREARQTMIYLLAGASADALAQDPELALLLALEAADLSQRAGEALSTETVAALQAGVQTSRLEMTIEGGPHQVEITADGSLVATDTITDVGSSSNEVAIWDSVTGALQRTLVGPSPATSVEAHPNDFRLAVGYEAAPGEDATVLVWDPRTGEVVGRVATPGLTASILWSPDGALLATVGWSWENREMPVTVWDADSMTEVSSFAVPLSGQQVENKPLEFVDDTVLAVAEDDQVGFYEVTTGQQIEVLDVPGLVPDLEADPKSSRLVVEGSRGTQVWDLESRDLVWSGDMGVPREGDPDRGWMAVGGFDAVVTIFDLADGSQVMTLSGHTGAIQDVAFHPSRDLLYTTAGDGETRMWDIGPSGPTGAGVIPIDMPGALALSPDGEEFAIANEASLTRYDSSTGALVGSIDGYIDWWLPAPVSPDWRLVAIADTGFVRGVRPALPEVWVRDLVTGEKLHQVPPCAWPKAISSDGSMLVLDGVDLYSRGVRCQPANTPNEIDSASRVVDPMTGEVLLDLENRALLRAIFIPAGVFEADRYLAIRSWDPVNFETVELHDLSTGSQVARLDIEGQEPLTLAFDPSGRYLAVGGQHSDASVFDIKALVEGASVEEAVVMYEEVGSGGVAEIAFGPDGMLATSAHDPHIRLWDIHTGMLLRELDTNPFSAVAFSPEGDLLYGDGNDDVGYSVRKLLLDTDRLVELAKSRVTRALTQEECDRYRLDPASCS